MTRREAERTMRIEHEAGRCASIICDTTPSGAGRPMLEWAVSTGDQIIRTPIHGFRATYRSGKTNIRTRVHISRSAAWRALERSMIRHGVEPGPWHLPGGVAGDLWDARAREWLPVARADGSARITQV